jgi:hypothetical protein
MPAHVRRPAGRQRHPVAVAQALRTLGRDHGPQPRGPGLEHPPQVTPLLIEAVDRAQQPVMTAMAERFAAVRQCFVYAHDRMLR